MTSILNNVRLTAKLPLFITAATLVVALTIGTVSYFTAKNQTQNMIEQKAQAILQGAGNELSNYLKSIEQDIRIVANTETTLKALKGFSKNFKKFGNDAAKILQAAYIEKNPHPTGQKHKLDRGEAGGRYDYTHARYHPWFRNILQGRSYYDIFLFDLKGNAVYSVFKELDFGTNLKSGKYKDTDLGAAFRAAAASKKPGSVHFFDFKVYALSQGAAASFISTPIFNDGAKKGVLVFQIPIDIINGVMSKSAGLGETGELMIVGSDRLMRNDSRFTKTNDILKSKVANAAVDTALSGTFGKGADSSYRGSELQYYASPFSYQGIRWALTMAQEADEIYAPVASLRNQILMIALVLMAVISLLGFFMSRLLTRPISNLVDQMKQLAEGDNSAEITGEERRDEIGDMAQAVAIFKQNGIERQRLEAESQDANRKQLERQHVIDQLLEDFREQAEKSLQAVASNADQMELSAGSLNQIASSTSERAERANEASGQSASSVQSVAAATEEMTVSIEEISNQVGRASELIEQTSAEAQTTDRKVAGLSDAVSKIGEVVSLIQDIAEQTNLLALNATIEAARAGDAGKGFAVVASEVKQLASQTAKATEDIASHITSIQGETRESVEAMQAIAEKIVEINEFTVAISGAVEQQNSATSEISRNIQDAAQGTQLVVENIAEVAASSKETNDSAGQVGIASKNVSREAEEMHRIVGAFLEKVAAA